MEAKQMLEQAGYNPDADIPHQQARFKIGDVVQLKSGGMLMTVTAVQPFYIQVAYFIDGTRLTDNLLPPDALVKVDAPAPSAPAEDTSYADMAQ